SLRALFEADAGYLVAAVGCGRAAETGQIGRDIRQGRGKAARIRDPDVKRALVGGTAPRVSSRVGVVRKAAGKILRELTSQRRGEGGVLWVGEVRGGLGGLGLTSAGPALRLFVERNGQPGVRPPRKRSSPGVGYPRGAGLTSPALCGAWSF